MENVLEEFEERVTEIDCYFSLLKSMDSEEVKLYKENLKRPVIKPFDRDVIKIMKASSFLLLYNLVESSIRSSFILLYSEITASNSDIGSLNRKFRDLWVDQNFRSMEAVSANQKTYRKLIREMIDKVIDSNPIKLDPEKLNLSGNLDARGIRKLLEGHEIDRRVHHRAFGGTDLVTIKKQRNALAHGNATFSEVGQMYAVEDLISIKKQAVVYLRSTLRNFKKYIENEHYAA